MLKVIGELLKVIGIVLLVFLLASLDKCIGAMKPTPVFISKEVLPYTPEQLVKLTQEKKAQAERDKQKLEPFAYCYGLVGTDVHIMGTDPMSNRSRTTHEYGEEFDRCIASQR